MLVTLKLATERTAHLANQLLTLARTESGNLQAESTRPRDLRAVVERITEILPRAIAKRIDLGLELDAAVVNGDELLIGELLSNLFDNAIAYAREGGRITVHTRLEAGAAVLEVEDDGPGIAVEEREKVFGASTAWRARPARAADWASPSSAKSRICTARASGSRLPRAEAER